MFNFISADLYKLKKSKVLLWIILGLLGIILLGNILAQSGDGIMTLMSDTMNYNTIHFKKNGTEIMPELLKGSNILIFFLIPIVINVFICDYKYETIKNTVSFQYPRTIIYISKMLVCSLFAIIIPFLYVILGLIVNLAFNGFNNIKLADVLITIKIVCAQLPIYIGFIGLMVLVGVVFKSNTATTVFSILYQFVILFISSIASNIDISAVDPITCLDRLAYLNTLSTTNILEMLCVGIVLVICSVFLTLYYKLIISFIFSPTSHHFYKKYKFQKTQNK